MDAFCRYLHEKVPSVIHKRSAHKRGTVGHIPLQILRTSIKFETVFYINKASAGKFMTAIQLLQVLHC